MRRVAITGDRGWGDARDGEVRAALASLPPDAFVVLGDARGVDSLARKACEELRIDHAVLYAKWGRNGRGAGPVRNGRMLDELLGVPGEPEVWFFHDDLDASKGTRNCVDQARARGVPAIRYTEISERSEDLGGRR